MPVKSCRGWRPVSYTHLDVYKRQVVNNVFDKHYWASIFPSGTDGDNGSPSAFIGGGREVRASVTFDF